MKLFLVTVLALAGLALLQFAATALRQDRARKAFHRYLEVARDSLDAVIQGWGAARIRRMYEEAMPK